VIRKLTVILLSGVICLLGATSALAYNEAPMLKELVDAGKLPVVEQRLPEEPLVVEPLEEIGQYGGTLHRYTGTQQGNPAVDIFSLVTQLLVRWDPPDFKTVVPNILRDWELSEDGKTATFHLRKGLKWSDGVPFTADDIMFWYEDVLLLSDELGIGWIKPSFTQGGELWKVEKVDDYTVQLHFASPYCSLLLGNVLSGQVGWEASWGGMGMFLPKHYLKQFHKNYVPEETLNEMAKEEGLADWVELFVQKLELISFGIPLDPDCPSLCPWLIKEKSTEMWVLERNPYFWKVDTAGNQLPYIDKIILRCVSNKEIVVGKVLSGEVDFTDRYSSVGIEDYPLLKKGEKEGGYRIFFWDSSGGNMGFQLSLTPADPVLRKIFEDVRFRQALSLAINREEINEVCFLGLGKIPGLSTRPGSLFYESPEEMGIRTYHEYNPEEANQLLDEMGLKWDSRGLWRLMPDGRKLSWLVSVTTSTYMSATEMVKDYWKDIGIDVKLKLVEGSLAYEERGYAGEVVSAVGVGSGEGLGLQFMVEPIAAAPIFANPWAMWAGKYGLWYDTEGEEGEEPPELLKNQLRLAEQMQNAVSKEEMIRLGKKLLRVAAENLWTIRIVDNPVPVVVKNNLRNVPEENWTSWGVFDEVPLQPSQFFFKK